jgi:hypothetical protein
MVVTGITQRDTTLLTMRSHAKRLRNITDFELAQINTLWPLDVGA